MNENKVDIILDHLRSITLLEAVDLVSKILSIFLFIIIIYYTF